MRLIITGRRCSGAGLATLLLALAMAVSPARADEPTIDELIERVKTGDTWRVAVPAMRELALRGEEGKRAAPAIAAKLTDEEVGVRQVATYVLGALGDASHEAALATCLADSERSVRFHAAVSLARIGLSSGALEGLADGDDPVLSVVAAHALGRGPTRIDALREALADRKLRYHAIIELEREGADGVEPLAEALMMKEERTPSHALGALARIGEPAAREIIGALQHWDPKIRGIAARHVAEMTDPPAEAVDTLVESLAGQSAVQEAAKKALVAIGKPAIDPLVAALGDAARYSFARKALIEIGKPAVRALKRAAKSKDRQLSVFAQTTLLQIEQNEAEAKKRR